MAACAVAVVSVAAVLAAAAAADVIGDVIKCGGDQDASSCLKVTALRLLDSALATDSLRLSDDISVDRRPGAQESAASGRHLGGNVTTSDLDGLLLDRVYELVTTRTVNVRQLDDDAEGRGKKGYKKKGGGIYLAMFGAVGVMLLKLGLATLALIAGKALLIGKVALLLSAIFGLKSLLSHHPQEKHAAKVIYAEPEVHGDWSRNSLVPDSAAQDLVYRGQRALLSTRLV